MSSPVPRLPSIRIRLLQLAAACIVPAALMAAALMAYDYERERDLLFTTTRSTVRAIATALDAELAQPRQALETLAASRPLKAGQLKVFHAQMRELRPRLNLSDLFLIGNDDVLLLHTGAAADARLPPLPDSVDPARLATAAAVTGLAQDPMTRAPAVVVMVPLRGIANARALGASIDPERVMRVLARQQLPAHWIVAVFDATGTLVARTHEMSRFLGAKGSPLLLQRVAAQTDAVFDAVTLDGIEVVTVYSQARETGWTVTVGIPRAGLVGEVRQRAIWLAGGAAVLLLFTLGLGWALGQRIVGSIQALRGTARALGDGQPVAPPVVTFQEAQRVGQALSEAGSRLALARGALARSEGQLRALVESALDAIVAVDAQDHIQLFNPAAARMFGCSPEQALGQPLDLLIAERQRGGANDVGDATLMTGRRNNGDEFPIEASVSKAVGDGVLQTFILRDISARLRAHDALLRSNLDLQQFAFVASHDMRGPLSTVSSYLDLLQRRHSDDLPEKGREIVERSVQAVRHLDALTEALLGYARIDAQARPFAPVDMGKVVQDVLQALEAPISEAGATVTYGELPTVWGDRTQLAQLMQNLLGNALKYRGAEPPQVRIEARPDAVGHAFSVADNGIGIEPRHQARIFEIFKRLHTQREYPGTGIGLAVCKRVVDKHGGTLWVESAAGQGSTFWFTVADGKSL